MLKSMTAFARTEDRCDEGTVTWEIRSVNHRYLETGFKLPEDFKSIEPEARKLVGKYLTRGKIDLGLRYRTSTADVRKIQLNTDMIKSLRSVEQDVLNIVHEGRKMSVSDILSWPGVIAENESDFSALNKLALVCLETALQQLVESRSGEGDAIYSMLTTRCQKINEIVAKLRVLRPAIVTALRDRWEASMGEKMQQWRESANDNRLEQEMLIMAQKLDVDEELDRLETHIAEVLKVLDRKEAVGRRLDFLMQELNREANTLGSKSQDSETTQLAVDLKVLIEQMREQVQNIE